MLRLIFFGSGEFGLPTLQKLHQLHQVAAVVSQPDRPAGRKRKLTATPIAQWAAEQQLPVLKPENVNACEVIQQIQNLRADASVVIAFGQKMSPLLLEQMGTLSINLHASLLPQYRGAAPINWAMIDGQKVTGNSVIGLAQKMDAGEVYAQATTPIDPTETAGQLHDRLASQGPCLVSQVLDQLIKNQLAPIEQNPEKVTIARKLSKQDGTTDFKLDATKIRQLIHGLTPWPGMTVAWYHDHAATALPLKILQVKDHPNIAHQQPPGTILPNGYIATSQGAIELLQLQLPGKKPMPIQTFLQGHHFTPADRLTALTD